MLTAKQLIPDFTLDSSEGFEVRASQYRGKRNLVIALLGSVPGTAMGFLDALAQHTEDLDDEDARVLVIVQETPEQTYALHEELGAPFIFLADCDGAVHRAYGGDSRPLLVITDRYGEIYSVHYDRLPNAAEVIASLRHINIMCDE
jgi:peroxiredoxin